MWSGFVWLMTGRNDGLSLTHQWPLWFHKMPPIPREAEQLVASQEWLSSLKLVISAEWDKCRTHRKMRNICDIFYEISDSHGDKYEDFGLLGYDTMYSGKRWICIRVHGVTDLTHTNQETEWKTNARVERTLLKWKGLTIVSGAKGSL
jgi:hypothetical protein